MAFYHLLVFVEILLVLQAITATHNSSSVNSYLDKICEEVECGKGTCNSSLDYTFSFICECEPGWKQTRDDDENDGHRFQPCIYPNCTMDYSCGEAPPPTPNIEELPKNLSFYDPCYWAYCGDGSCSATSGHGYKCECRQGYTNLMNVTAFPCYSDCVIGADCVTLGITVSNDSTDSAPASESYGSSTVPRNFLWFVILIVTLAMTPW